LKTKQTQPVTTIQDLNYSAEEIAEVKRIQREVVHTRKKDAIRSVLKGPLCVICHSTIPTKKVTYDLEGVVRIETYCAEHFSIFEETNNIDIGTIAETYNCEIAPTGAFTGLSKEKEGYSETTC
jgi:hypothetical protein